MKMKNLILVITGLLLLVVIGLCFVINKDFNSKEVVGNNVNQTKTTLNETKDVEDEIEEKDEENEKVEKNVENEKLDEKTSKEKVNSNTTEKKEDTKKEIKTDENAKYTYSSADKGAMLGDAEMLYVYSLTEKEMKFKYHARWDEEDVEGVAKSINNDTYVYEVNDKKIEIKMNSLGEQSVKVTEYENGNVGAFVNLFTDDNIIIEKENVKDKEVSNNNLDNMEGKYKTEENENTGYKYVSVELTNQTDNSINFKIDAAKGYDVDHVNVGEISGVAKRIDVPTEYINSDETQVAFKYTDENKNEITFICTKHKKFQYVQIVEKYEDGINPYAGHGVYFEGVHDFVN